MDYAGLLKKAKEKLPMVASGGERFEIPKATGHFQGNRTVITNFNQIVDTLHREKASFLKYLLRELATPGEIQSSGYLVFGTRISSSIINEKIQKYVNEFVICKECGKPDTKIEKENGSTFLKCQACGARKPIKAEA